MNQQYRIIPDFIRSDSIIFNNNLNNSLIKTMKIAYLQFGARCYEVKVAFSSEIEADEILLSNKIIEDLKVPSFLSYNVTFNKNKIIIGPYIGMLTEKKETRLKEVINNLTSYVYGYEEIGGAVLVFSEEGVDMDKHLIKGFIFNPTTESWVEGIYTYPASIFKRTGIKKTLRNHFQSILGDVVFNNYIFNKWESHQWLSCFEKVEEYLPKTIIYNKPSDIRNFLKEYKTAYIKPIYGSQGSGILRIEAKGDWYILRNSQNGEDSEKCFKTKADLNKFLKDNLTPGGYIIQIALNLISFEERSIDFRYILVKGGDGDWNDIGLIARFGTKGNITSNVSTGGSAEKAEVTFKNVLNLSDEEVSNLRERISTIGKEIAYGLERCGISCGNLGIDIAIDTDGHIWIIEVNNINPNHTIALDAKDRQMFYKARLLNMLYAKRLAGFPKEV